MGGGGKVLQSLGPVYRGGILVVWSCRQGGVIVEEGRWRSGGRELGRSKAAIQDILWRWRQMSKAYVSRENSEMGAVGSAFSARNMPGCVHSVEQNNSARGRCILL